jgi:hypothetical protein
MSFFYSSKLWLKTIRWQARRSAVAIQWGKNRLMSTPAVLGNAMPKSGSHLIIQVLQGLTKLGPFVNPGFPPVNRAEDNQKLKQSDIVDNLIRMLPGDIAYGYIAAEEPYLSILKRAGRATIFVYRDPRDMVVSQVFYATEMHEGHGMHEYYSQVLQTMEERINAAILGVDEPGSELSSIRERWDRYLGWFDVPEAFCLRFEDLILNREAALGKILDYLGERGFHDQPGREQAIQILGEAINPRKSGTFRKGKPGNWQEHFTIANKDLFKKEAGSLLIQLGYEEDNSW